METIKTARKAPGFYTATVNGVEYEITNVGGQVAGYTGWVWNVAGESADDVFATKADALAALAGWIAAQTETVGAMRARIARTIAAANARDGVRVLA